MSIEEQANAVKNMLLAEIDKSKNIVFDGLLNNNILNSIPESLFVNYFLPCFMGEPKNSNWVMEWISIAGTPMAEVGVFKDGTNEILFSVPSILNTNNLFLHKQGGDIGDIFTRFDQINSNTPSRGLGFLIQALNSKNDELINNH
ncbi:MAG: glucuronate isomerase [Erysipelotrichaceae bacterium]|nr:glucuronate isomerase [Erysipelotrichaceae bacterium]